MCNVSCIWIVAPIEVSNDFRYKSYNTQMIRIKVRTRRVHCFTLLTFLYRVLVNFARHPSKCGPRCCRVCAHFKRFGWIRFSDVDLIWLELRWFWFWMEWWCFLVELEMVLLKIMMILFGTVGFARNYSFCSKKFVLLKIVSFVKILQFYSKKLWFCSVVIAIAGQVHQWERRLLL